MRDSLGGSQAMPVRTPALASLAFCLIGVACSPPTPTPQPELVTPPPCAQNDTIYGLADSARGVRGAFLRRIVLPPPSLHGTIHLRVLVDAFGKTNPDSVTVLERASPKQLQSARQFVTQLNYFPATLQGCAVSYWFEFTISTR